MAQQAVLQAQGPVTTSTALLARTRTVLHTCQLQGMNMAQQAVLQAQAPCGYISSAACANSGPVADYERPVALS